MLIRILPTTLFQIFCKIILKSHARSTVKAIKDPDNIITFLISAPPHLATQLLLILIPSTVNPCHARPPYGRTYPLGPGILLVYPPNQKDFINFYYCFNNVLYKLK